MHAYSYPTFSDILRSRADEPGALGWSVRDRQIVSSLGREMEIFRFLTRTCPYLFTIHLFDFLLMPRLIKC
jgi:hypothetical protein